MTCACDDGSENVQTCSEHGHYEACQCEGSAADNGRGISPTPPRFILDAGTRNSSIDAAVHLIDAAPHAADAGLSLGRDGTFIAVYAAADNIWLVDSDGVSLVSFDSARVLAHWNAPRVLLSAAFDGTQLVALDGAKLTTLRAADLSVMADGTLTEACSDAVLLSASRVVCGTSNSYSRIFYTYDASTGKLLASAATAGDTGQQMRAVPGLDAFITLSSASFSTLYLYQLGADNKAALIGAQANNSSSSSSANNSVLGFDDSPAKHVVTSQGLLLGFDLACADATNSSMPAAPDPCFRKDGALGTLTSSQTYAAIDGPGPVISALIDPRGTGYFFGESQVPVADLRLQTIDVPSRTILSDQGVSLPALQKPLALRALPDEHKAVLIASKPPTAMYSQTPASGYDVIRITLE
ncbi:MAG: hypothetical protein JWN04_2899 [Myxococcaceae bacterium]|nr:hypothetical protein [Myxococcaceae bacterium]